ncbi:MAG TPA: transferase hexapeptide repeat family protein [Acidimicrobiales bacterium]|jgi:carbonic anhydrase/acetyltransferase-like protein (isoleucine patch superfamily)|nr:transferase hexapeptide repeat family protein [Acidimicrobiales bacterium]
MGIYEIEGVVPVVDPTAFVHPEAVLIGDVVIDGGCYVGPLASLRGDFGRVMVHAGANVQDGCVLHCFPGRDVVVEEDGHIGHGAVLHGCHIGRGVLVGMNSVVMDGAIIGDFTFVGACSFVRAEMEVPAGHVVAGNPARVLREVTDAEMAWKANGTAVYQQLARRSRDSLRPAVALASLEENRPHLGIGGDAALPLREHRRS